MAAPVPHGNTFRRRRRRPPALTAAAAADAAGHCRRLRQHEGDGGPSEPQTWRSHGARAAAAYAYQERVFGYGLVLRLRDRDPEAAAGCNRRPSAPCESEGEKWHQHFARVRGRVAVFRLHRRTCSVSPDPCAAPAIRDESIGRWASLCVAACYQQQCRMALPRGTSTAFVRSVWQCTFRRCFPGFIRSGVDERETHRWPDDLPAGPGIGGRRRGRRASCC
jgi:hypothetical protein